MSAWRPRWPAGPMGIVADAVSLLLAAGAAVTFLLGHGGWALALGCAALVAGLTACALGWRHRRAPAAALGVVVVALAAAGLGATLTRDADPPVPTLAFDPQVDAVPYCRSYTGSGRIPDGSQLLLFDRATADATAAYYFHGQAERTGRGWVARELEIGREPDRGVTFDLYAQLVTEETARVLRDRANIVIFPADETQPPVWLLRDLPGRTATTLRLTRGAGAGECTP